MTTNTLKDAAGANNRLEKECINTIRFLAVDGVQKANSGHPGMPMEASELAYVLWTRTMNYNPMNPEWPNRDRFNPFRRTRLHASLCHASSHWIWPFPG